VDIPRPIVVDLSTLTEPDPVVLDALVHLQLAARRLGTSIRLENACSELVDLVALVGLSDVLPLVCRSGGVEVDRQVEQREQVLVDEEVETGDAPA
jgi:anti-anti-sigma regulatory factor